MQVMKLRPHHLLDIVTSYGVGDEFVPSPYGHAVHTCADIVLDEPETLIRLVAAADFICEPCIHLVNGRCEDVVGGLNPPVSKQEYNDRLDRRLLEYMELDEGATMTVREFLQMACLSLEKLSELCHHPAESAEARAHSLTAGIARIGTAWAPPVRHQQ